MDSLDLLRDSRPTEATPSPEAITAARAALMSAIEAEKQGTTAPARRSTRPRRALGKGWRWGLVGATALAAATGLVISQALAPTGTPGAPTSAVAAQLNAAADRAVATDASLQPGQYRETTMTSWQTLWTSYGNNPSAPLTNRLRKQIFLPKDPADYWYFRGGPLDEYKAYDAAGRATLADPEFELDTSAQPWKNRIFRGPAGVFTRPVSPVISLDLRTPGLALVGDDPEATLAALRAEVARDFASSPDDVQGGGTEDSGGDESAANTEAPDPGKGRFGSLEDSEVFSRIWSLLNSGTATPAQQGTLFKVLALLPTDRVSTTQGTVDGKDVTSFDWVGPSDTRTTSTISIDTASGLVLRLEQRLIEAQEAVPAGTIMASTEFSYKVLDHGPAGATPADLAMPDCDAKQRPPKGYDACGTPEPGGSSFYGD